MAKAKPENALCKNVNKDIKPQALTLAKAIISMQNKIEKEIPTFEKLPIIQQVISAQGERVLKSNPYTQEFRAIVRDYASALKNFDDITKEHIEKKSDNISSLQDFRSKFKVAK